MKKIAYDSLRMDSLNVIEDSKCCLKVAAVITKEGVYDYPDGRALKSRMELLKASNAIRYAGAKIVALDHPESMVVMSQKHIQGGIEKPYFDRNKIRAVLNFDKRRCTSTFLDSVRKGKLKDVSIGFYYQPDNTGGVWKDPVTSETKPYDYVMRDIVIDHVAAGVLKGRCSFPSCGIGVDTMMKRISVGTDKVVKRGNQWCIEHTHGSAAGTLVKGSCHSDKSETEAMHRAIEASKGGASSWVSKFLFGDQRERPPKEWMDNCLRKAQTFASDPGAFCGNIWFNEPQLKASFGGSSVSIKGGKKKTMVEDISTPTTHEEEKTEFSECVAQRVAEGMPREQAEALCAAATVPADEPEPSTEHLDQEEEGGETDLTPYEQCVNAKMSEGIAREDAEAACRAQHPIAEEDQEEPTEMERCIVAQKELGKSDEEARTWCEAQLAGEHEEAGDLIERSKELINMKQERDVEALRASRRRSR